MFKILKILDQLNTIHAQKQFWNWEPAIDVKESLSMQHDWKPLILFIYLFPNKQSSLLYRDVAFVLMAIC